MISLSFQVPGQGMARPAAHVTPPLVLGLLALAPRSVVAPTYISNMPLQRFPYMPGQGVARFPVKRMLLRVYSQDNPGVPCNVTTIHTRASDFPLLAMTHW